MTERKTLGQREKKVVGRTKNARSAGRKMRGRQDEKCAVGVAERKARLAWQKERRGWLDRKKGSVGRIEKADGRTKKAVSWVDE